MSIQLRPYQEAAVDAVLNYWRAGGENPLIELATGCGKSLTQAALFRRLLTDFPSLRIVSAVHSRELVEQNAVAMMRA